MPTYEYHCEKCKSAFDAFQSMKDDPYEICPEELCQMKRKWGKGRVRRQLGTGAGLIFKGSGFYITDYRSEGYKEAAKKDKPAETTAASEKSGAEKSGGESKKSGEKAAPAAKPASKDKSWNRE